MKRLDAVFLLALFLMAGRPADARPVTTACPATGPVVVDGRLDDAAWQYTVTAGEMTILSGGTAAPRQTTFRFLYTDDALLFGARCEIPAGGSQVIPKSVATERDGAVFADESIELYLQPAGASVYYHLVVNADGVQYDGTGKDAVWDGDWTARVARPDGAWELEARLPFAMFGLDGPPESGTNWRLNVAGNDRVSRQYYSWSPLKRGFHEPESFGSLRFAATALGIGPRRLSRRGRDVIGAFAVSTPDAARAEVHADLFLRTPMTEVAVEPRRTLAAGATETLTVAAEDAWDPGVAVLFHGTVEAGDVRYVAPSMQLPMAWLNTAGTDPEPVTVANAQVSLTFDRQTGHLLAAANTPAGVTMDFGPHGIPVLEVDTVPFIKNPRFFREDEVQTVTGGADTLLQVDTAETAGGAALTMVHQVGNDVRIRCVVRVPAAGVETEWQVDVESALPLRPSKALVVHRVRFPMLRGIPEDVCGEAPRVVLPTLMGQRFAEPTRTLGRQKLPYPGRASMGWLDFYGDRGGLYLKVGDIDPLPQTELLAQGDGDAGTLAFGIERWSLCWPGDEWHPGPVTVAIHAGDWHTAADLYRAWFRQTFTQWPKPAWLRESDGYVMSGSPTYEFADFPRMLENAQAMGINYIQLWSEMTGGEITYHACFFPNPYMGTEDDLKKAIAALHDRGGHIGFYMNFNTGDPLLGTFVRQPRLAQKIPEGLPLPAHNYMQSNWLQQSLMSPAGSYSTWGVPVEGYLDGYWNVCPGARQWTDYYYWWVAEKWAREYGADVWYLDSCPVSRGAPCFASDHGHERPQAEGQAIIAFYRRLRAGVADDFGIMQEYTSDRLLPYSTHALGLVWHAPHAHPEVLRYTLPEYALFSGMCNGTARLQQFYPGEEITYRDALERVFLIGNRYEFAASNRPPEMVSEWGRRMVDLRRACRPEMNEGDFLDNIGLGPLPERVLARLFRRADRGRLAVTLLDRREEGRTPFTVQIDLAAAGVGTAGSVELVTLDGRQKLTDWRADGHSLAVVVPVYAQRPAALLIETEAP